MQDGCFEARTLNYAYSGGPLVVRNVSLISTPRSMTAIIGANGSGKSTLIRMLAGLLQPQSGTVTLEGVPLRNWDPRLRARKIAYVPQSTTTSFPFRVIDIVMSGRAPYAPKYRFENTHDLAKVMEALESTGATELANRPFTSLSGGERQMVILARALAQEPRVLLLDEPSSSLDLKHRADLIRTLLRLRNTQGISAIMITHDLQLTGSFDQLVALRCGEIVAGGLPGSVLRDALLREIYGDSGVSSHRIGAQTLVWVDL
jgi:iron complex transport system ATP-binding protein